MTDFFSSDAGQCASLAKQFLEGALTLNEAQRGKGRILFRPTLMLAGHGLELMLKACFYLNGKKPPTSRREGHNALSLWEDDVCEPVRGHVVANAIVVAEEARESGAYPDVPHDEDITELILEYVAKLSELQGALGNPLRYPTDPDREGPRTPFLVASLWRTADDLIRRPNQFKIDYLRGKF